MKIPGLAFLLLGGLLGVASAKPYAFPTEHCQLEIPAQWHETTKPDELVSVENDNSDSFTLTVNPLEQPIANINESNIGDNMKQGYLKKGFELVQSGPMTFQGQPAFFVVAKKTQATFSFYLYNILLLQGNDLLSLIMVGDNDPSQDPQFKAILDSFSITPTKPADAPPAPAAH